MDRSEFEQLATAYERETRMHSLPGPMRRTPSFQRLVAAGEAVVPSIIESFEKRERWGMNWVLILMTITGESPIQPKPVAGGLLASWNVEETCDAWVEWWRAKAPDVKADD